MCLPAWLLLLLLLPWAAFLGLGGALLWTFWRTRQDLRTAGVPWTPKE